MGTGHGRAGVALLGLLAGLLAGAVSGATLEVGPERPFARIEEANAAARPGDVVLVHPRADGRPYEKTGVTVRGANLTFRGAGGPGRPWVKVSGEGFDHSGRGSVPRAIFQFNRGADGCTLEGLDLSGAHNATHNGAGVRINQANHVTIRNCSIHHNDMGVMSNGDGTLETGVNQRIEGCAIHHNGDFSRPGYNHNLYLGGTSVTLRFCEVHSSLTGHNVKSRAHYNRLEYCYVHHSANRELDLVDGADTARPGSHAVLLGNVLVKDPKCKGNRGLLHFGQDGGGEHDGTAHLAFNTIVTPFITPVVTLSALSARAELVGNFVCDGGVPQGGQKIVGASRRASLDNVGGRSNWFSGGFDGVGQTGLDRQTNVFRRLSGPVFVGASAHDFRLVPDVAKRAASSLSAADLELPPVPGARGEDVEAPLIWQYRNPLAGSPRPREPTLTAGAYGAD